MTVSSDDAATRTRGLLLVEDNPGDAELVQDLLFESGRVRYEIVHVLRLTDAVLHLQGDSVDVVLLDLRLPDGTGANSVEAVRRVSDVPIVVLTGAEDEGLALACIDAGADDYLYKNEIGAPLLQRAIGYAIRRRREAQKLVAAIPDAVIVVDREGIIRFVNNAAEGLFGSSRGKLVGEPLGFSVAGGGPARIELSAADGPRIGEMRVTEFEWEGSPAYLASIRDITAEHRLRDELDTARARLHHALASSVAILCVAPITPVGLTSGDFAFSLVSEGVEGMLGYTVAEAMERGWWMRTVHADDLGAVLRAVPRVLARDTGEVEYRMRHKGGQYRWLRAYTSVNREGAERPAEIVSILIDVTARKDLEHQFQAAQRMEAVGILAGGVAHDFNNLLTAMFAYADGAAAALPENHAAAADVRELRKVSERAAALTRQLLAFSRQQVLEPRIINLNDVVGGTSRLLHRLISEDVRIVITLDPNIHAVYADPGQLEQIIVNLTVNAHDAMPNGGTLTIETENVGLDAEYAEQHPEVVPGDYAVLAVTDTGSGMDEETRSRLFEPFYTTKGPGKGTGLGLSTVYGIVKQSKGHIWVYSELGNGTTLRVYLPKADHTVGVEDATAEAKPASRGDETILFVEDDQAVRSAGAEALRRQGYNVIVAEDGQTALEMMERERTDLDLLVTDVVMPRLGGRILAARIRELAPDTKILFTSGYSREAVVTHGILASNSSFLQKPYSPGQLGRKVREVLDEG